LRDGQIEFLGRIDHQVKVRGYRIELGEIETTLSQHPSVGEAVVIGRKETAGVRLVAYVVAAAGESVSGPQLRKYLRQELPQYMIPGQFVMLDQMPLTANGKIDRSALPEARSSRAVERQERVGPRTAVEETLVRIWREVLRVSEVGIHDNFFDLGGDSILSIQIVSRANQVGLPLVPRHVFQYHTVAELAQVAEQAAATEKPLGRARVTEAVEVALTPIQRWFFAQNLAQPHHWNQSLLFEVRQRLSGALLREVLAWLVQRHEGLRLRFVREGEEWQQRLIPVSEAGAAAVSEIDLSGVARSAQREALERAATQVQASLDLTAGPLLRAVLFELGAGQAQRLLLVAHHLVIDGVSWRILLEEMRQGYLKAAAGAVSVAVDVDEVGSFASWAERLWEYAETAAVQEQAGYWNEAEKAVNEFRLPRDMEGEGAGQEADAQQVQVELTEEQTRGLLQDVPRAYRTQINEVLLTALGRALSKWSGRRRLVVELDGHGREEIAEGVGAEVRGAVGWFTSLYPVVLEAKWDEVGEGLKAVKEQLRRVPGGGLGYGLLRYRNGGPAMNGGEVMFNYLGQLDRVLEEDGLFVPAAESPGERTYGGNQRSHKLTVVGGVRGGKLGMTWKYNPRVHHHETIERVARDFIESLQAIINHCQLPESKGFTPSDFPTVTFNQQQLDKLISKVGKARL
jgi:non-ribosomal peptide synthase protein (TIGR01720 family)